MFATLVTVALGSMQPPAEPLKGDLQAAIWYDLEVNFWVGSGSLLASLWYEAKEDGVPDLHIRNLTCDNGRRKRRCAFDLIRDGGPKDVRGQTAPPQLRCKATFKSQDDGWKVVHIPPHGTGHSRTSLQCEESA